MNSGRTVFAQLFDFFIGDAQFVGDFQVGVAKGRCCLQRQGEVGGGEDIGAAARRW